MGGRQAVDSSMTARGTMDMATVTWIGCLVVEAEAEVEVEPVETEERRDKGPMMSSTMSSEAGNRRSEDSMTGRITTRNVGG